MLADIDIMKASAETASSTRRRLWYGAAHALMIGDRDDALAALETSVKGGLLDEAWIDRCPALAPIRDDARFVRARDEVHARAAVAVSVLLRRGGNR